MIVPAPRVTPNAGTPLPTAQFTANADAICNEYRHRVGSENGATGLVAQEHVYAGVVDTATRAIASLRQLSPPPSERAAFTRYLRLTGFAIDDFVVAQRRSRSTSEKVGTNVEAQDFETFQRVAHDATVASAVARRLGLRVCGSPGSDWL